MFWFFIGVVAKLARRWSCKPEIVGSSPTDSTNCQDLGNRIRDLGAQVSLHPKSYLLNPNAAGVAQMAQERSPGTTEAVSSILTTGSRISECGAEAAHLPWEQVHAGSIPATQTKCKG
jgi:hypothetical protein